MRGFETQLREFLRNATLAGVLYAFPAGSAISAASVDELLLPPEQAFIAEVESVSGELLLHWKIAPGYYVYRDKFRFSTDSDALHLETATLPAGQLEHDEFFGEVEVLRDTFTIALPYDTSGTGRAGITAISQGCSDLGVCYPPYEQTFTVALDSEVVNPDFSLLSANLASDSEFLPPDQAFALHVSVREDAAVVAEWEIADGYYLYREKFAVTAAPGSGYAVKTLELPPGINKTDEYFGAVEVFYQVAKVVVVLTAMRSRDDTALELDIVYQGCADAGLCYPPITKSLRLEGLPSPNLDR